MSSSLFWNQPPTRNPTRSVDPLGFDALREAMADKLVPLLTGATSEVDEYLWTLIGLRWARKTTGASVDAQLFDQGFAPFERALKQYWYKFSGRKSGGVKAIKELCDEARPNLQRSILLDQRATGLLGNYIVSLRGMRLVQKNSLRVLDDAADRVLQEVKFAPSRGWGSSWVGLSQAFDGIELSSARQRLGRRLFGGESEEMTRAGRAALARPKATTWAQTGRRELDREQGRLAGATTEVVRLEAAALNAFADLLRGVKVLPASTKRSLRSLATAMQDADPFPSSWAEGGPLRSAIHDAISSLARGRDAAATLVRLHIAVTREVRQTEPWLAHLGDSPSEFQQWRPSAGGSDFRFANLRILLRQTRWRPDAA